MKKLLIVLLSGFCLSAFAATPTPKSAPDGSKMIEKRLDHMQKNLELTADQRSQLQTILQNEWKQQQQLRKATRSKVDAVLTAEQRKKMQEEMKERHEKMRDRWEKRGHGDHRGHGDYGKKHQHD